MQGGISLAEYPNYLKQNMSGGKVVFVPIVILSSKCTEYHIARFDVVETLTFLLCRCSSE